MRILLADDQPDVRSAIRLLLQHETGEWQVIGDAENAPELRSQVKKLVPDLVLLDWELDGLCNAPDHNGIIASLRALSPKTKVVVLSGRIEARAEAFASGADGFVSKGDPADSLLAALWKASITQIPPH